MILCFVICFPQCLGTRVHIKSMQQVKTLSKWQSLDRYFIFMRDDVNNVLEFPTRYEFPPFSTLVFGLNQYFSYAIVIISTSEVLFLKVVFNLGVS